MGPRVLIVDDHDGFRKMARLLLARAGYDVVGEADDGTSAISAARALRPDIILLDIQLPDIDGFEVARALRPDGIDENIILVSSRDAADYGRRIRASGVLGFIAKADVSGTNIRSLLNERDHPVEKENQQAPRAEGGKDMERDEMLRLFEAHRAAEAVRDIDGILKTFVPDPFLETFALGLRSEGRDAVRAAYAMQFFSAFPDLTPADEGMAFGDDTVVVWGTLRGTSLGDWLGVPAGGGTFAVPFANVVPFRDGLMAGEIIYFDLATLCEQAGIPLEAVRAAAAARRS